MDYIKLLVEDIHSVTMATINNEEGQSQESSI